MLPKASIEHIVAKQRKALYDMPAGHPREISGSLPYLSDRPLLIGGMRGSGRAMLLGRMLKDEYPEAWYTDFDDPRLAGFDESDFAKLDRLIRDSGKGILLLNKVDCAAGWLPFLSEKPAQGIKVIATVSLPSLLGVEQDMRSNRISGPNLSPTTNFSNSRTKKEGLRPSPTTWRAARCPKPFRQTGPGRCCGCTTGSSAAT